MSVYRISGPVARSNPARRSRSARSRISSSVMPGRSSVVNGRLRTALQHGDHAAVGEGREPRGQVRVQREQPGGRRREPVGVHLAVQRQQLLLDVGARRVVVEDRVEVQALLQRGQRQDVPQRRAVQGVDVGLGERHQGEVAGRVAAPVERGQPGQRRHPEVRAERRDVLVGEHPVGPGDGGGQFVARRSGPVRRSR